MTRSAATRGFTLVEVMVALLIFGLIASGGVALLSFSVRAQAAGAVRLETAGALARVTSLLAADLAQAVDRPTRDERGVQRPAFVGTADSVMLVRGGWANPDEAPRAALQKVAWRRSEGGLERIAWPGLDGARPAPAAPMLSGVRSLAFRYRLAGAWSEQWDGTQGDAIPHAIEVTIDRGDDALLRALFLVGTGTRPHEAGDAQ